MAADIETVLLRVIDGLGRLGIEYLIGGSIASGMRGVMRMTNDIDLVAAIVEEDVPGIVAEFGDDFYIDASAVRDAVRSRSAFNMLHLATMTKVDVFVKEDTEWAASAWARRSLEPLGSGPDSMRAHVVSAEDLVLQKLHWFRLGGSVSDRQWGDVIGILKVQRGQLDHAYLWKWAPRRGVADLLEKAVGEADAGLSGTAGSA